MKASLILASLSAVFALPLALPASPNKTPQCEYSFFEKFNMGHNHDVNTGSLLFGSTVLRGLPKLLGAGCAPAWAIGGAADDATPTKVTPQGLAAAANGPIAPASIAMSEGKPMAAGHHHGA